jgi:hypothetical protein
MCLEIYVLGLVDERGYYDFLLCGHRASGAKFKAVFVTCLLCNVLGDRDCRERFTAALDFFP